MFRHIGALLGAAAFGCGLLTFACYVRAFSCLAGSLLLRHKWLQVVERIRRLSSCLNIAPRRNWQTARRYFTNLWSKRSPSMLWVIVNCDISLAAASCYVLTVKVQIKLILSLLTFLDSACLAQFRILRISMLLLLLARLSFSLPTYQPFWSHPSKLRTFGLIEQFLRDHCFSSLITQ